jgi:hypothetical protein
MNKNTSNLECCATKEDVFLALKQFGIKNPENLLSSRDGRSMLHDLVYLMEVFGIDLGFKFVWYVK